MKRDDTVGWHIVGWSLVLLTGTAWAFMEATGMLDRLDGAPGIYAGMDKEQDTFTAILVFIVALPLWVGGFVALQKAFGGSTTGGRVVRVIGIVGIVLTCLVVLRLATLK